MTTPSSPRGTCGGLCRHVLTVPTVLLLGAQGLANKVADRSVSTFLTLWLQHVGFGTTTAALISGATNLGCALGAGGGGLVGDLVAARLPARGRVLVAQLATSLCAGAWLAAFFGLGVPSRRLALGAASLAGGALGVVGEVAAVQPVLAEVVPPSHRAAAMAWQYAAAEASGAIFGSLGPAYLAQALGYVAHKEPVSHLTPAQREANATALSRAVLAFCLPAWALCVLVYAAVGCTYRRDKARIGRIR